MAMKTGGGDELNSEINVTPMVDVMLVLLIIFMITSSIPNQAVDVTLPPGKPGVVDDKDGPLILEIDKARHLTLGKTPVTWKELSGKLSSNERLKTEHALFVGADTSLPYGVVVTAMSIARNAGITKVMMLTDPSGDLNLGDLDQAASH
jgi:biopolymer transport protein TolR